ncbi:MAG: DUF1553 domain-containing protein [Planctomycetaceae bacterium]|nr:DUF1553 domain-containing protein [Planctomycetaceae bacterium]
MSLQRTLLAWCLLFTVCHGWPSLRAEEEESPTSLTEPSIDPSDYDYWAYQPVQRPEVPELANDSWSRNPIDKFILARLKEKSLQPVERADRLTLLRRITYDLTGLPPTPQEIEQFPTDDRQDAYSQQVNRLLDDRGYGEHWGQHWLDLVRFAETDGFEHDKVRPEAWRYRDWVIDALNRDLPYDQFLQLQIAGDELAPESNDALIATGFLLAGPDMPDINLQAERRHNFLNSMTANVGEVILGLRFGCAQCHHHRTDPISQHDFYRLRAFFETIDLFKDSQLPESNDIKARVTRNKTKTEPVSYLWIRGDFRRQGPELEPRFPRVLTGSAGDVSPAPVHLVNGRRRALAEWLTTREHPLTARVMVNRVWQQHFGVGIIPTTSDFGWMGEGASHPDLLDWLAAEFMDSGWSLKHIHRLILNSATYQQASYPSDNLSENERQNWNDLRDSDPDNRLLGRMNRRRLPAEAIRDTLLAASGELNRQAGGPGVRPPLPAAVTSTLLKNQWPVTKDESEHARRTVYLFARRNLQMPMLKVFDKPDKNLSCPRRSQTTIAPQALHLLNSEFTRERARSFAARIIKSSDQTNERIENAYQIALGRKPTPDEEQACRDLLAAEENEQTAWLNLCHALFNLNEFVYVD